MIQTVGKRNRNMDFVNVCNIHPHLFDIFDMCHVLFFKRIKLHIKIHHSCATMGYLGDSEGKQLLEILIIK